MLFLFAVSFSALAETAVEKEAKLFEPAKSEKTSSLTSEKRFIAENIPDNEISKLRLLGCKMRHKLKGLTSFTCPPSIVSLYLREARIFKIVDLPSDQQIKADKVWADGVNGSGVNVVILDTGIDASHIELADSLKGQKDFVNNDDTAEDDNGHGTHVAGIITANGVFQVSGTYATGVAPGAGFYMLKVCDAGGSCLEDDIMAAMEYAISLDARIMSLSLGGGNFGSHCDFDPLAAKANWVVNNGITVVAAAGNDGSGVSSPACASKAIAVGAVDSNGVMQSWSNRGPALDILAPGVSILSAYSCLAAPDCDHYWYARLSGTSMATPHVSGVVALLLAANGTLNDSQIKNALYSTADSLQVLCWAGGNKYLVYSTTQLRKFCKCAEGDYGYVSYGYTATRKTAYSYIDAGNNENWGVASSLTNSPVYKVKCNDSIWYYTNQNYYFQSSVGIVDAYESYIAVKPQSCVPSAEVCDGADNDCDSSIDEGTGGSACNTGLPGICSAGTDLCIAGQLVCNQINQPTAEMCNNLDDDCDGAIDEDNVCAACVDNDNDGYGDNCALGPDCNDNNPNIYPNASEACNSVDDNCNSQTDETFGVGASCSVGVGACKRDGTKVCTQDGLATECDAVPGTPSAEICNNIDDDCDSSTDESLVQQCGVTDVGICQFGTQTCTAGTWGQCIGAINPSPEICNTMDDDCDGAADEGDACMQCWKSSYGYTKLSTTQLRKFCKCAEGRYGYVSYSYQFGSRTFYEYTDKSDNTNWAVISSTTSFPVYRVKCMDSVYYYTNKDYSYP